MLTAKVFTVLTTDTRLRFSLSPFAKAGDTYWLDSVILTKVTPGVASVASVEDEAVIAAADVMLQPGPVVGSVQTAEGTPVNTAVTLLDMETEGTTYQLSAQTDGAGAFRFDNVPVGNYEVRAAAIDGYAVLESYQVAVGEENEALQFTLEKAAGNNLYLPVVSR